MSQDKAATKPSKMHALPKLLQVIQKYVLIVSMVGNPSRNSSRYFLLSQLFSPH